MTVPREIYDFSDDEGLTFLEHLAHNLTIAVRIAAASRQPQGQLTDEQARKAMYWVNEATHNVVQLTRDRRIGREHWDAEKFAGWVELWIGYTHAEKYNVQAVERSILETLHPYRPPTDSFTENGIGCRHPRFPDKQQ